ARRLPRRRDVVLVGARADNREPLIADFEVLQNGRFADGRRRFYMPHWPQPGLIPRDPARGTNLARLVYKGFDRNLHPAFRSAEWRRFLAGRGIEWVTDSMAFAGRATDKMAVEWPDFRQVDAVLAVRPDERSQRTAKPATKLLNAWLAGVPALLGPEYAFRELRRSELDYLEVGSLAEAEEAVRRLQADPGLYRAMVENGRARGAEYTVEATVRRWAELLYETIPARAARRSWTRRVPLPLKVPARALARLLTLRPAR
ncbi:MAG TPA: glycosyltransferase, partial [Thermoanaerobaculia bacterium]|nr:glycosyltransferase [Thermoanaerobaculia bacterium]